MIDETKEWLFLESQPTRNPLFSSKSIRIVLYIVHVEYIFQGFIELMDLISSVYYKFVMTNTMKFFLKHFK